MDINSPHRQAPQFRVIYQLTKEQADLQSQKRLPASVLTKDEELRSILSKVDHPLQLSHLLTYVRLDDGSPSPWRIWKGSPSGSKTRGTGLVRFILQYERVSTETVILIAHYRSDNHDDYQFHQLPRLRAGHFAPVHPSQPPVQTESSEQALVRVVRAPGNLLPPSGGPLLRESFGIPPSLDRLQVAKVLHRGVPSTISTPHGMVWVTPGGDGGGTIRLQEDEFLDTFREYPASVVDSDEAWETVRRCAAWPETDPCLALSETERSFLQRFQLDGTLPLLVEGSPGSGKTTLLTLTLAALVHESAGEGNLSGAPPLFVTYSKELRNRTRQRLVNALVVQRGWKLEDAEMASVRSCRTFAEVVNEILEPSVTDRHTSNEMAELSGNEWDAFSRWWVGKNQRNKYVRGGRSAVDCYRALTMFIFGYLPETSDRESTEEVFARWRARRHIHDVSEDDLKFVLELAAELKAELGAEGSVADRSVRAKNLVSKHPDRHCIWGHIIVDEAQDLSELDIELLIVLSRFSITSTASSDTKANARRFEISFPLIIAGDEMQSVGMSGFTFQGARELIKEVAADFGLSLPHDPHRIVLKENFRNLRNVAELVTSGRRLLSERGRARHIASPTVFRKHEGEGLIERITQERPLHKSIWAIIDRPSSIVITPSRIQEQQSFLESDELKSILGDSANSSVHRFRTVEGCKGLEYDDAILCGFAGRYADDQKSGGSNWLLNAIVVAASRARNRVIFLDRPGAPTTLFQHLSSIGKLVAPIKDVSRIHFSDASRARAISSQMIDLLRTTDPRTFDKASVLITLDELLSETHELLQNHESPSAELRQLSQLEPWCSAWRDYLVRNKVEDWDNIHSHPEGSLWEWIVDHAVSNGLREVLESILARKVRVSDRTRWRLFQVSCALAVATSSPKSAEARVGELSQHLLAISPSDRPGWLARVSAQSLSSRKLWDEVLELVMTSGELWNSTTSEIVVKTLVNTDPSDWLAYYIDVRSALQNPMVARNKLTSSRSRLPVAVAERLELVVLAEGYGLTWLDEAARHELLAVLRNPETKESDLISAMAIETVTACTDANLGLVSTIANPKALQASRRNPQTELLAQAALSAMFTSKLNGVSNVLTEARETLYGHRKSGANGQ